MELRIVPAFVLLIIPGLCASADELDQLRSEVASLEQAVRRKDDAIADIGRDVRALILEIGKLKGQGASPLSAPFLASPPPSSDAVGVAKFAVFDPRFEADSPRRRDMVTFRIRRMEGTSVQPIGDRNLGPEDPGLDLPLDQNGALYVVDWSTSEGYSYNLVLRDGASGQTAATVQVKPLQTHGRFIFVGYRVE